MSTGTLLEPTDNLLKTAKIKLEASSITTTRLENVIVTSPVDLKLDFTTPVNNNDAMIVIWEGLNPYNNLNNPVYSIPSPKATSGSVNIHCENLSLLRKQYTVGYCVGKDCSSLSATASIINGQTLQNQETSIYLINMAKNNNNIFLTIAYNTPNGNAPVNHRDWIEIFSGDTPKTGNYIGICQVPSQSYTGTTIMTLPAGSLQYQHPYILEYNPGSYTTPIAATYSFIFNE